MHGTIADLNAALQMGLIGAIVGGCVGALVGLIRWAMKRPPKRQ